MKENIPAEKFVVIINGKVKKSSLRDYEEVATQTMQALKVHNKDILFNFYSKPANDSDSFRWCIFADNIDALINYFSSPIIALYMANHEQLGESYSIELHSNLGKEEFKTLNEMGLTIDYFSFKAGYDNLDR
tara:strand:- start:48 stop:443 length:396 start_codon:yes stop_codon:yes gene_type:complete